MDIELQVAVTRILRYFDLAGPAHHADEELELFPWLLRPDFPAALRAPLRNLVERHRQLEAAWQSLAEDLRGLIASERPRELRLKPFVVMNRAHIALEDGEIFSASRATAAGYGYSQGPRNGYCAKATWRGDRRVSHVRRSRRRPFFGALFLLLGIVLTITFQLISGYLLAMGVTTALPWHVVDGLAPAFFLLGEWAWLLDTKLGRVHLKRIFLLTAEHRQVLRRQLHGDREFPLRDGLNAVLEGLPLWAATVTVALGIPFWRGCGACFVGRLVLA